MRRLSLITVAALAIIPTAAFYVEAKWDGSDIAPIEAPVILPAATATVEPVPVPVPATPPAAPAKPAPAPQTAPKPAPQPAPAQGDRAKALDAAVARAMAGFPGEYSIAVQDLRSGWRWTINPDQRYHTASTVKLPVSLYALEQHRAGKLGWQDLITYTQDDFESPGGVFESAPVGSKYPVQTLVNEALSNSNNIAVNMLGRYLGWENVRAYTRSIGAELYRAPDSTPQATVKSELGWWLRLEQLSRTDPRNAELLLQPLRNVSYDGRIAVGLPKGVPFLHKYGSYDGNEHDTGWIMGEKPFLLIVMTHGAPVEADAAIARVTSEIYGVMTK